MRTDFTSVVDDLKTAMLKNSIFPTDAQKAKAEARAYAMVDLVIELSMNGGLDEVQASNVSRLFINQAKANGEIVLDDLATICINKANKSYMNTSIFTPKARSAMYDQSTKKIKELFFVPVTSVVPATIQSHGHSASSGQGIGNGVP